MHGLGEWLMCAGMFAGTATQALCQAFKEEIDHRGGIEREHLTQDKAADNRDAQRTTQFGTDTGA
jgi:hypothetical protein